MSSRPAMILLVEDNDVSRKQFNDILGREGYEVVPLSHGQEALDYLENNSAPDLILLDMLMPVLDGWHFLTRLQLPVPVIIITGTVLTREWAKSHGCAGFLRKPIEEDDLLAEVRHCLG